MRDDLVSDEELLATGPGFGSRRRTVLIVAVLLVIAGLTVGLMVSSHNDHPRSKASPQPALPVASGITPTGPTGTGGSDAAPAVLMNGFVYVVRDGLLYMHALTRPLINETVVGPFRRPDASYIVVGDAAHGRIWVVQSLVGSWTAYEYASGTLDPIDSRTAKGNATGAAVLAGDLYIDTNVGVVRMIGPGASRLDATAMRGGRAIAADPIRGRLLLLDLDGSAAQVRAERPGALRPLLVAAPSAVIAKGSLAVVGGRIWAAGFGERGAVLIQLDPRTLRPLGSSPIEAEAGPGAVIVASGRQDFLVRSGDGRDNLWCVDARDGAVRQTWTDVAGPALLDAGPGAGLGAGSGSGSGSGGPRVFTLSSTFIPRPLSGTGCRG